MFTGNAGRRAAVMLTVAAASWGITTSLSDEVLRQLRPADLFVVELLTASAVLSLLALFGDGCRRPRGARPYLLLGLLEPGALFLLFDVGLRRTSAVSAGLLVSTQALFGVAAAAVFLRERVGAATLVALASGVAGAVLITAHGGAQGETVVGDALVLAGSAVGGIYVVMARRLPPEGDTRAGTAYQFVGALPVAAVVAAVTWSTQGSALGSASARALAGAVAVGVLGGVIPYLLVNTALPSISASTAALMLNLTPLFAVASAAVLVHETPTLAVGAGGLLLLGGLAVLAHSEREAAASDDGPASQGLASWAAPSPFAPVQPMRSSSPQPLAGVPPAP
jgi:drug/metabolite transporter (DMT)-like permease